MTSGSSVSQALREATHDAHRRAERAGLMPALLAGRLPRERYVELLVNLRAIYVALEAALATPAARAATGDLASIGGLARVATIDADLARLDRRGEPSRPLEDATVAYVERIETLAREAPARLAAHAYVRYLGDLSGGQILARIVARAYGDAEATRFYGFGDEDEVARLVAELRRRLDGLDGDVDALASEARDAFERHVVLFEALERRPSPRPSPASGRGSED